MKSVEDMLKEFKSTTIDLGNQVEKAMSQVQEMKNVLPEDQRKEVDKAMGDDENLKKAQQIIDDFNFNT